MYIFYAYRFEDCLEHIFQNKKAVKFSYHKLNVANEAEFDLAKKNFEAHASATGAGKGGGRKGTFKSTVVKGKKKSEFKDGAKKSKTSKDVSSRPSIAVNAANLEADAKSVERKSKAARSSSTSHKRGPPSVLKLPLRFFSNEVRDSGFNDVLRKTYGFELMKLEDVAKSLDNNKLKGKNLHGI